MLFVKVPSTDSIFFSGIYEKTIPMNLFTCITCELTLTTGLQELIKKNDFKTTLK